jgi:hypothetical protein
MADLTGLPPHNLKPVRNDFEDRGGELNHGSEAKRIKQ